MAATDRGCKMGLIGPGAAGRSLTCTMAAHTGERVDRAGVFPTEWERS